MSEALSFGSTFVSAGRVAPPPPVEIRIKRKINTVSKAEKWICFDNGQLTISAFKFSFRIFFSLYNLFGRS